MPSFTAPNGSAVDITGPNVVRIRDAYPEESTETNAKCRLNHPGVQFVTEASRAVVPAVKSENTHIGQLTLPNDKPVWFNGTVSRGPVRLVSGHPPKAQSALYVTDKIQYVTETPEAVRAAVAAAGGNALPIPTEGFFATRLRTYSASSAHRRRYGIDATALIELLLPLFGWPHGSFSKIFKDPKAAGVNP